MTHFIEGDRQGGGMTQGHHGQGVTDENGVGSGLFHQSARETVPGRQHGDRSSVPLVSDQLVGTQGGEDLGRTLLASNRLGPMRFGRLNLVRTGREQPHGMLWAGVDSGSPSW